MSPIVASSGGVPTGSCRQTAYYTDTTSAMQPVGSLILDNTPGSALMLGLSLYISGPATTATAAYSGSIYSSYATSVQDSTGTRSMHQFSISSEGSMPSGYLVQNSSNHLLFGVLQQGPAAAVGGAVYSFDATNSLGSSLLWQVTFSSNDVRGCTPVASLIIVGSLLYGTHSSCGDAVSNAGTVFTIDTANNNAVAVLHAFGSGCVLDGKSPQAPLLLASNGLFYGSTTSGSTVANTNYGTLFQITAAGALTTIWTFQGKASGDGSNNYAGLVQGSNMFNRVMYGVTKYGGNNNAGAIFSFIISP